MTRVFKINGVDYGPLGNGALVSATPEPSGPGKIGQGTASLLKVAGGYDIRVRHEVEDYEWDGAQITAVNYGGFIGRRGTDELLGAHPAVKTWTLDLQDQNLLLVNLVGKAPWPQAIRIVGASYPSFAQQVAQLVSLLTTGATKSIDAVSYVADLVHTGMPDQFFQGQTLNAMLLKLCADAVALNSALRPRFYIGPDVLVPRATFGGPALYVYDAASPPVSIMSLSDAPTGGQKTILLATGHPRSLDAGSLVQYRQGMHQATGAVYTASNATSISTYPNPYDVDGAWKGEVLVTTEATAGPAFQAKLNASVAATSEPRETLTLVTDAVPPPMPGQWVDVTLALEGLSAVIYQVAGSSIEYPSQRGDIVRSKLELGLQKLLLGDDPNVGGTVPPIEGDNVPPDTPGSFTLASNTFNYATGLADLVFTWAASTAGDLDPVDSYFLDGFANRVRVGATTALLTATLSVAPGATYSATIQSRDTSGNYSARSTALTGTAASGAVPSTVTWPASTGWQVFNTYDPATHTTDVSVTWDANAGGEHVLSYLVYVTRQGNTTMETVDAATGGHAIVLPEERPGVQLTFGVRARNIVGTSASLSSLKVWTTAEAPPPTITSLISNGSFEKGTTDDPTIPVDWSLVRTNAGGSIARTTAGGATDGEYALYLAYVAGGGGAIRATSRRVASSLFEPGQDYRISVDYYHVADPGVTEWNLNTMAFDKDLNPISGAVVSLDHTQTGWANAALTWTIPAGTVSFNVFIGHVSPNLTSTAIYIDNVKAVRLLAEGDMQDGAITTAKLATGAVTANELASGAVTAAKIAANVVTNTHLEHGSPVAQADTTAHRPGSPTEGQTYFDLDLGIPIWYYSGGWVDATGSPA